MTEAKTDYFKEAQHWEDDAVARMRRSEKRAWMIASVASVTALLSVAAVAGIAPLKSVEPFVIRVDNNTGVTDVVSTVTETDGAVKESAKEVLDKYWLGHYIRRRESYLWETRDYDRKTVGLFSSHPVQQEYAAFTDPESNPQAPVALYAEHASVDTAIKAISFLNRGEIVNDEKRVTALVRYTKTLKRNGAPPVTTHWAATVTFIYRDGEMSIEDRGHNPLGFQVIAYRNDPESAGG